MKRAYLAILMLAVTSLMVAAQDQVYDPDGDQSQQRSSVPAPPTESEQTVAHISFIHGDVSMLRGDSGDWIATTLNTPIMRGDWVATGANSRAEVQLDYANMLRLSASSEAKVADLTHRRIQIQMASGYANYSQFKGSEVEVEIDTPNVAVRPLQHGRYRIEVNSDEESIVIVREGEAEVTTPEGSTRLREGEQMVIRGSQNPEYRVTHAPGKDDWDRWNKDRDNLVRDAEGWRRTNRYYTGAQDLDAYGHWTYVPGYGNVWAPYNVGYDWAPYQAGRWVWEPYYGWTWVSYEPWGWAPYHYGRWFFYGASWYWWPGPVHVHYRPIWAPAFVVFLGFGHHGGFGFGSIGWLPCGPHDYFYPWYGRGFNNVRVTNVTNITNINVTNINIHNRGAVGPLAGRRLPAMSNVNLAMNNARVRNAIATVRTEDFGRGVRPNRGGMIDAPTFRQAQAVTGNLPVMPGRESLRTVDKAAPVVGRMQPGEGGRFFSKTAPPASGPSFQQQQSQVREVFRAHGIPVQSGSPGAQRGPGGVMTPAPAQGGMPGPGGRGPGGVMTPAPAQGGMPGPGGRGPGGVMTPAPPAQGGMPGPGGRGPGGVMTPAPPAQGGMPGPGGRGPGGVMTPAPPAQGGMPGPGGRGPGGVMTPAPPAQVGGQPTPPRSGPGGVMTPAPPPPAPGRMGPPTPKPPSADQGQRGGRDGWRTFGPPRGQGQSTPQSQPEGRAPGASVPAPPSGGNMGGVRPMTPAPPAPRNERISTPPPPQMNRPPEPRRPAVNLNPPIVAPRPPESAPRNNTPPPPPSRMERSMPPTPAPPQRIERSSPPPPSRIERSAPAPAPRSEPRSSGGGGGGRSSGGGGGGRSSGGGGGHSGGGNSGGDKGSHDHRSH